ncbi:MAG: UbiA family prenyltransferase [Mariniblastus sp.]|nr:UbiA family prenyltransferase [Mariniblastus sp.]
MSTTDTSISRDNHLLPWLQLLRISAAPTAISNILVGFLLVHGSWEPVVPLILLMTSSFFLYSAGMVSNDIVDVSTDREDQRHRPIADGRVGIGAARWACIGMFLLGTLCGAAVGSRSLLIALLLTLTILLYNGPLKRTWAGPVAMGLCRSLNVLLGASFLQDSVTAPNAWLGWPPSVWWVAISLGILITGLTCFARSEARPESRRPLIVGAAIIVLGLAGFATTVLTSTDSGKLERIFPLLILLLSAPVATRLLLAIRSCRPRQVQFAVISLLKSLIIYDASICLLFGQPNFFYALIVLSLLLPCLLLGKWISST